MSTSSYKQNLYDSILKKPESERRRYAYLCAAGIFFIIVIAWLVVSVPSIFKDTGKAAIIMPAEKESKIKNFIGDIKNGWQNLEEVLGKQQ